MTTNANCGDTDRLRGLLEDRLPPDEQESLTTHLETCKVCRLAFEQLAGGGRWWDELREVVRNDHLRELMKVDMPAGAETVIDPTPLDFLDPSEEPGEIGKFGPYSILEMLGNGGMGIVLKAFDAALSRPVAIKVMAPQLAASAAARKRFTREARAAASVRHEHVVSIHAVDQIKGLPFLVMPYIPGRSLQDRIDRDGPLELKEILRVAIQVAKGLSAAHEQGLVHRDVKPANILLENGVERVKITDFGLALAADDASLTRSGFVAGTPHYMSPEQARGESVDYRADLYSLGSLIFAMCTGHPPFRTKSVLAVLRMVCDERPPQIRELRRDLPDWLEAIVTKLHANRPESRFKNAAEVAELLSQHLARVQQPSLHKTSWIQKTRSRKLLQPLTIASALAFVFVMVLGASESTGVTNLTDLVATVLHIRTPEGTLVVEVAEPDVKVSIDDETHEVLITGVGIHGVRLKPGKHQVQATKDGRTIRSEFVTITRGGKRLVKVDREPELAPLAPEAPEPDVKAGLSAMTFRPIRSATDLNAEVWSTTFSPDGKWLLWGGKTERLAVFEFPDGPTRIVDLNSSTGVIAFSPDGLTFAKSAGPGTVKIWDVRSMRLLITLQTQSSRTSYLTSSTDAKALIQPQHGEPGAVIKALSFSPDGTTLAVGGTDRKVRIWHLRLGKELNAPPEQSLTIAALKYTPDGKCLLVATGDWSDYATPGEVTIWNTATCQLLGVLGGHPGRITSMELSPDGTTVATGCSDGLRLWDLRRRSVEAKLAYTDWQVNALAYSPNGRVLASSYNCDDIVLWNVVSRSEMAVLKGHEKIVVGLKFSPDGMMLVSCGIDKTLKFWDTTSLPLKP